MNNETATETSAHGVQSLPSKMSTRSDADEGETCEARLQFQGTPAQADKLEELLGIAGKRSTVNAEGKIMWWIARTVYLDEDSPSEALARIIRSMPDDDVRLEAAFQHICPWIEVHGRTSQLDFTTGISPKELQFLAKIGAGVVLDIAEFDDGKDNDGQ